MTAAEVNFSDLLNKPTWTLDKLRRSPSRALRVHRRGEEDLLLVTKSRAEDVTETASATTRLFIEVIRGDDQRGTLATRAVTAVYPWTRFLSADEVREFATELVGVLEGGEALDNYEPVAQLVTAWRHTAELHADPELARILSQDGDDLGAVPEP